MNETTPSRRFYTPMQVSVAAFVGGPLPACWLASSNSKAMGERGQSVTWLIVGVLATAAVLYVGLVLLPKSFPPYILPLAYTIALREAVRNLQGSGISDLRSAGAKEGSWGVVAAASLVGLVLMLGLVALIVYRFPTAIH